MIDLSTCQITSASHWGHLTWYVFNVVVQPHIMLPILAGIITVPWLFRTWRWKRSISRLGVVLLVTYALMSLPVMAKIGGRGLSVLTPNDNGQPADAIVVLGRGGGFRPSRVQVATELWQQQRAPLIFASGRGDAIEIGQMLEASGVPREAIQGEPCSATTNENAEFTAALLQPQGVKQLILITDPPHLLRSVLTFRSFGFEVIPHPSPMPESLNPQQQKFLVFREWMGLVSYGMLGRYFSRQAPDPGFETQVGLLPEG
ncbi:MAG: YdcF family protein [Nodosilinea sp.]